MTSDLRGRLVALAASAIWATVWTAVVPTAMAQTAPKKPAAATLRTVVKVKDKATRALLPKPRRLPNLDEDYEFVFPAAAGLLPVRFSRFDNSHVSRDRIEVAPGVQARLVAGKGTGMARLRLEGPRVARPRTIDFAPFYNDHALWGRPTDRQINDHEYALSRGASAEAYHFFGLARAHGKAYVGVDWYHPPSSGEPRGDGFVFRLEWDAAKAELTPVPVRRVSTASFVTLITPYLPALDTFPGGDLALVEETKISLLGRDGRAWREKPLSLLLGKPASERKPDRTPGEGDFRYAGVWLRGRWLVARDDRTDAGTNGAPFRTTVTVYDLVARRVAAEHRWGPWSQ